MKEHLPKIFSSDSSPTPWERMAACGFATGTPLVIGIVTGHAAISVFGALTGYLLALNDHFGQFRHRLLVLTSSYFCLALYVALGFTLRSNDILLQAVLAVTVYWLGLLGGRGAELERGVLFATLGLTIALFGPPIAVESRIFLGYFSLVGYFSLLIGISILAFWRKTPPEPFERIKNSWRKALTGGFEMHAHAATYALAALSSIWISRWFELERGYWTTITVLLIMKPDRTQSIYKTTQRLAGTLLAVLLVSPLLGLVHDVGLFAIFATSCGFMVPWGVRRNYMWVAFFATVMVLCLLEIAAPSHNDTHLPFVRLQTTIIGCAIAEGTRFFLQKRRASFGLRARWSALTSVIKHYREK